jgi:hypothetical protein
LGKIGQSEMSRNLKNLAEAAHSGSLVITPDTELALRTALADIRSIKEMLLKELRVRSGQEL